MRHRLLATLLRWLAAGLVLRVLATILAEYPAYFPPDFRALFLHGREATFAGLYRAAFYVHILSGPVVLANGLLLMSVRARRRRPGLHRVLGRVQVGVLLLLVLPSGVVMARHAFGGGAAGLSFLLLSATTAGCAVAGVVTARRGALDRHRVWMTRCYVLICSAVVLRLTSGAAGLVGVSNPEAAYVAAAWASWLAPLAAFEVTERWRGTGPARRDDGAAVTGRPQRPAGSSARSGPSGPASGRERGTRPVP